jgi:hypothetical protein
VPDTNKTGPSLPVISVALLLGTRSRVSFRYYLDNCDAHFFELASKILRSVPDQTPKSEKMDVWLRD